MGTQIKAIVGLGNPGYQYLLTRHSIGFRVVDALADKYNALWKTEKNMETATILLDGNKILLCKPMTYMNSSGAIVPFLNKKGIKPEHILVVHDELEKRFGSLTITEGGGARGHNGLRSLIEHMGSNFVRLRVGIGRPERREIVPNYVLQRFSEPPQEVTSVINHAVTKIEDYCLDKQ